VSVRPDRSTRAGSLRLIDATIVREAWSDRQQLRLHYSCAGRIDVRHFALMSHRGSGRASRSSISLARERALGGRSSYAHILSSSVVAQGGHVTVRFNPRAIRLLDRAGSSFPRGKLRAFEENRQVVCWDVQVTGAQVRFPCGTSCVSQKPDRRSGGRAARSSARQPQGQLQERRSFLRVRDGLFTTTTASAYPAGGGWNSTLRWQIELVFSAQAIAQLGHLPKKMRRVPRRGSTASFRACHGAAHPAARVIFPGGYDVAPPTESEPLAESLSHAPGNPAGSRPGLHLRAVLQDWPQSRVGWPRILADAAREVILDKSRRKNN